MTIYFDNCRPHDSEASLRIDAEFPKVLFWRAEAARDGVACTLTSPTSPDQLDVYYPEGGCMFLRAPEGSNIVNDWFAGDPWFSTPFGEVARTDEWRRPYEAFARIVELRPVPERWRSARFVDEEIGS